jgi:hypothetical protein
MAMMMQNLSVRPGSARSVRSCFCCRLEHLIEPGRFFWSMVAAVSVQFILAPWTDVAKARSTHTATVVQCVYHTLERKYSRGQCNVLRSAICLLPRCRECDRIDSILAHLAVANHKQPRVLHLRASPNIELKLH